METVVILLLLGFTMVALLERPKIGIVMILLELAMLVSNMESGIPRVVNLVVFVIPLLMLACGAVMKVSYKFIAYSIMILYTMCIIAYAVFHWDLCDKRVVMLWVMYFISYTAISCVYVVRESQNGRI